MIKKELGPMLWNLNSLIVQVFRSIMLHFYLNFTNRKRKMKKGTHLPKNKQKSGSTKGLHRFWWLNQMRLKVGEVQEMLI